MQVVRPATVLVALLALAACAERPAGTPATPGPADAAVELPAEGLVLQVELTGGFVTPETALGRLPTASVHADGRVFVEGPVPAIFPGPAWPNVQVLELGRDRVGELADRALAAGVAETADLGMPPLADVPSTRFTLVTTAATHVREVYGLAESAGMAGSGLTEAQEAARGRLRGLLDELTALALSGSGEQLPVPWTPEAVSALVRPWSPPADDVVDLVPDPLPWPGPELPGPSVGTLPDLGCVTATGEQAAAVVRAAQGATALTPWQAADGSRWSVSFRPLLPHESGCEGLTG